MFIDNGVQVLAYILNGEKTSDTVSGAAYDFPSITQTVVPTATTFQNLTPSSGMPISGANMRLVLQVTTTAISLTQTFSVILRIKGSAPSLTLSDAVGTPTLTTNISLVT